MRKITIVLVVVLFCVAFWFIFKGETKKLGKGNDSVRTAKKEKLVFSESQRVKERKRLYYENRTKADIELFKKLNEPFQFLGKVIDQDGSPLGGMKIRCRVSQPKKAWHSNTVQKTIYSDEKGSFSIHDKGSGFSFESFEKEGYRMSKGHTVSFVYSNSSEQTKRDDPNVRTYTLIKEDELQGLIPADRVMSLAWNGKPVRYNVKTGRFGEIGEIQITANRGNIGKDGKFDWSFKIEVPNGGVIETTQDKPKIRSWVGVIDASGRVFSGIKQHPWRVFIRQCQLRRSLSQPLQKSFVGCFQEPPEFHTNRQMQGLLTSAFGQATGDHQ